MSLILEALRKLERDRPRPGDPDGVVLLAPKPWPAPGVVWRRWVLVTALLAVLAGVLGFGAWLTLRPGDAAPGPASHEKPSAVAPATASPALPDGVDPTPTPTVTTGEAVAPAPRAASQPQPAKPATRAAAVPVPTPTPAPSGFRLSAIGDHEGEPIAVINDRVVHVGDAVSGARIVAIDVAHVELELSDGRRQIVGF
jgi:hypothetical protein